MLKRTMLLSLSVMIALAASSVTALAIQDPISEDLIRGTDYAAENSSYHNSQNNSSISFFSQSQITSSPVNLSVASGYYSAHPIAVGTGIGSRTNLANTNANSATSMSHEVGFAQDVSGKTEYAASSRSSQGEYGSTNSATTHMQIDETVTSGKVHIGVLSGGDDSAWKNPAIEIDEEYIGTYHIAKNFTINNSYTKKNVLDGWLGCCGESYIIYPPEPAFISADDVFNCLKCRSR